MVDSLSSGKIIEYIDPASPEPFVQPGTAMKIVADGKSVLYDGMPVFRHLTSDGTTGKGDSIDLGNASSADLVPCRTQIWPSHMTRASRS